MKWVQSLLTVFCVLLASCNESSSSPPATTPPASQLPAAYRTDLLVGYYGEMGSQVAETADHVNLLWVWGWESIPGQDTRTVRLREARQYGVPNVVMGLWESFDPNAEQLIRARFDAWRSEGLLDLLYGVTPVDEPDGAGSRTEAELRAWAAMLRRIMADYPELARTKLAVIYSPNARPAIDVFDLAGWDDYDLGSAVLGEHLQQFKALLRPDQGVILIPGGADGIGRGSRQDPYPFFITAQTDQQVKAIVSFVWFDGAPRDARDLGIRSNGMRESYCEMGKKIVHPEVQSPVCPTPAT